MFKNYIELYSLHTVYIGEMIHKIIGKWSEGGNDEDKRVSMQVLELFIERDSLISLNEWVFDRGKSIILLLFYVSYI